MADFRGMLLPVPTVFVEDGRVDDPVMRDLIDYYIAAGVDSLFVTGSFGQGPAMSLDERKHVAELVISQTAKRIPVAIHVGTADPYTTIELGRHSIDAGADALGLVGPYYYSDRSPDEIRAHYRMVGKELSAPILLYNNPKYSGYAMGPELMGQIVDDAPNIIGAKLAMGTIDEALNYREVLGDEFRLFALASSLYPGMLVGITGTVSPPLAVFPELGVELVRAIDDKDYARALEVQKVVIQFHSAFLSPLVRKECGRAIYGAALQELGFPVKMYPRWPTGEVTEQRRAWLADLYRDARSVLARKAA